MYHQQNQQNKLKKSAAKPYKDLYIYYLEGRLKSHQEMSPNNFIGNWEEDNFSFLFFSQPALGEIERLLKTHPSLTYIDSYQMPYDQWHGERFKAFKHGRLHIIPPWEIQADHQNTVVEDLHILLDPGVVFGTGSHPTTHDCLEALELAIAANSPETVMDLGTGTGLLALAAAKLGCKNILAVDLNLLAAKTANENVRLNAMEDKVIVVQGRAEDFIDCPADLVIANMHYDVVKHLIDSKGFLAKERFILSGLLRREAKDLAHTLAQQPLKIIKTWVHEGIWHTFYGIKC